MTIKQLVIGTLNGIMQNGKYIPIRFQTYEGDADTYITFFVLDERGQQFADDDERATRYTVQVDVWSKVNYDNVVDEAKKKLKEKGFIRNTEVELYEKDVGIFHKAIRFFYVKNN